MSRRRWWARALVVVAASSAALVVLSYRVHGAVRFFADHDELYWNATGPRLDRSPHVGLVRAASRPAGRR